MTDSEQFESRIARLERKLQLATRFAMITLLGFVTLLIVGQVAPQVPKSDKRIIEAEGLVIKDANGSPRIRLGMKASVAMIEMLDRSGTAAVELSTWDANYFSSNVSVKSRDGHTATLSGGSSGVDISLRTPINEKELMGNMQKIRDGKIEGVDTKSSWIKLSLGDQKAEFSMWKDGQARGGWFADRTYTQLSLSDPDGKARAIWDIAYGAPTLALLDQTGKSRLVLGRYEVKDLNSGAVQARTESSILLFGENGKVIFSAP